jgi:hypothetical protein
MSLVAMTPVLVSAEAPLEQAKPAVSPKPSTALAGEVWSAAGQVGRG